MQAAAMTSRFLTGRSSKVELADSEIVLTHGALLRHIVARHLAQTVHSRELFVKLTNELIQIAEQALVMRDLNTLEEVSSVLMNLPVDAARQIGTYYHAVTINRKGHADEAKTSLETVADNAPITYRARAIQTLGGIHHYLGQLDEALRFQLEVLRVASDQNGQGLQTRLMAGFEISIIKSLNGDHTGALSSFSSLGPMVNLVGKQKPFYFYLYCSELAIELGELGASLKQKGHWKLPSLLLTRPLIRIGLKLTKSSRPSARRLRRQSSRPVGRPRRQPLHKLNRKLSQSQSPG
jgi:hypothetical protein